MIHWCSADIMEMGGGAPAKKVDPYVLAISIFAYACLAVAGTAVCLYAEVCSTVVHSLQTLHANKPARLI